LFEGDSHSSFRLNSSKSVMNLKCDLVIASQRMELLLKANLLLITQCLPVKQSLWMFAQDLQ
jgi:hypothetical protein